MKFISEKQLQKLKLDTTNFFPLKTEIILFIFRCETKNSRIKSHSKFNLYLCSRFSLTFDYTSFKNSLLHRIRGNDLKHTFSLKSMKVKSIEVKYYKFFLLYSEKQLNYKKKKMLKE